MGVVMIIREGVRIITSAGGDGKVEGYKNIGRIVAGLFLAWGSYVILYNVNSDLIAFKPLRIKIANVSTDIQDQEIQSTDEFNSIKKTFTESKNSPAKSAAIANVTACSWCQRGTQFNLKDFCAKYKAGQIQACGAAPKDALDQFNTCDITLNGQKKTVPLLGQRGSNITVYASPAAHPALCKAVQLALEQGYEIRFASVYRDFQEQAQNVCNYGLTNGEYGCVGFMGKIYRAHQVAFYLVNGRFAVGDLHQLKERPPEIWLRNENHGRAKLKREDVVNIRHLYT
jgi:hypothetical protein